MRKILFLGLLLGLLFPTLVQAANPATDAICPERFSIVVNASTVKIPVCRNMALNQVNNQVTRAIIMIHGRERNAVSYYDTLVSNTQYVGHEDSTLLIAPQFLEEVDIAAFNLPSDMLFWEDYSSEGSDGAFSISTANHPRPVNASSYTFIDTILTRITNGTFPNLQDVVIAGHSAGGQFLQRYAAINPKHQTLINQGLNVKYISSNPSSYMYLSNERHIEGTLDTFAVPDATGCSGYNHYGWGLDDLVDYPYVAAIGAQTIFNQFPQRRVIYLSGELDTEVDNSWGCGAFMQGENRYERSRIFFNHLGDVYGNNIYTNHTYALVPNVGHTQEGVFSSVCGLKYLFDIGADVQCSTQAPVCPVSFTADASTRSLIESVALAQRCPNGGTVNLAVNHSYILSKIHNTDSYGNNALPRIEKPTVINGNTATLERQSASLFRFFKVQAGASLTLNDITLKKGQSAVNQDAGAIYNFGNLTINETHFIQNFSGLDAGAIRSRTGNLWVSESYFGGNRSARDGGAIRHDDGNSRITRSYFSDNRASQNGGAIRQSGGTLYLDETLFYGNQALGSGDGGAIHLFGLGIPLLVSNSTFESNIAAGEGGAINISQGVLTLVNSTFRQNNSATDGGAVRNYQGTAYIINTTMVDNVANRGRAVYASTATYYIHNSIFNNAGGNDCGKSSSTFHASNNLVDDASCGTGFTQSANMGLGSFGDYGGYTHILSLTANSIAVDAGNNSYLNEATLGTDYTGDGDTNDSLTLDQRLSPRVVNSLVDIGAFEFIFDYDVNHDGIISPSDIIFIVNRFNLPIEPSSLRADVNWDGTINSTDAVLVREHLGE